MDLLIDWGNTQLKYVLVDDWRQPETFSHPIKTCDSPNELLSLLAESKERLGVVLTCSVRADEENAKLSLALSKISSKVFFAKTSHHACGIQSAYANPENLGIDRWLAVLAASKRLKDISASSEDSYVGVISIGTAITLDIVNLHQHFGGHILPGRRLMRDSLKQTGRVRADASDECSSRLQLGNSTTECVEFGINSLIEGYLVHAVKGFEKQYPISKWLIHGGGGKFWHNKLSPQIYNLAFSPALIFEGLKLVYKEQQKVG